MPRASLALAALLALPLACSDGDPPPEGVSTAPCSDPAFLGDPVGLQCGRLIDRTGRPVALRGVNARVEGVFDVSFSDGRAPLEALPAFTADDAAQMKAWGFDSLRLPITWSGVEPTRDGGFDEAYLGRVSAVVDLAAAAGLLVLIDFHQDAYSKEIGEDGAPLWAIEPPPETLLSGPLTDLGDRRMSEQVKKAFATFFGDDPKGAELRTRFSAMAAHVAGRFKDHPGVLGFELFNEPVFASAEQLLRLHKEAFAAVRAAAPSKLVFFEPPSERNFLDGIGPGPGPLGPGSVYAPHIYKYAFTSFPPSASKEQLAPQSLSAVQEASSWGAGLAVTEWGFDPKGSRADEYLTWQSELQDEAMDSASFFWLWKEESQGGWGCFDKSDDGWTERARLKQVLARVRPAAVAGWPRSYSFDRASGAFSLVFVADPTITTPTLIAVAPALGAATEVRCDGAPLAAPADAEGRLQVDCGAGTTGEHTVEVRVAPLP